VFPHDEYEVPQLLSSMLVISGAFIGFTAAAVFARRYLPHVPMLNRMILEPMSPAELEQIARREALVDYSHLVGHAGVTTTPLSPSGKARIGADHLDVMTEGEFVPRGTAVTVARVKGSRIVVRVQDAASRG
jgi:membrane-bound serine protease (ClpP class)